MNHHQTLAMWRRSVALAGLLLTLVLAPSAAMGMGARPAPLIHRQPAVTHLPYPGRSLGVDGSANAVEHRLLTARLSRSSSSANAEEQRLVSR